MAKFEIVVPPELQRVYDNWHFAPATICNGMIHCSGFIGTSPDGEPLNSAFDGVQATAEADDSALADFIAIRDPEAQFDAAFQRVRAVLECAGASLGNIVEMTSYHVDINDHMAAFMTVKDRHIAAPYPAWTAIGISELIIPGGLMELSVIAAT